MTLRILCRAIVLDQDTARILLVRNKGAAFWYPPGGGWKESEEDLQQCVVRETEEETGIQVLPVRLLYVQEFKPNDTDVHLELFWFAYPISSPSLVPVQDKHGLVEEARWFSQDELGKIKVFPTRLRDRFWRELSHSLTSPNPLLKRE